MDRRQQQPQPQPHDEEHVVDNVQGDEVIITEESAEMHGDDVVEQAEDAGDFQQHDYSEYIEEEVVVEPMQLIGDDMYEDEYQQEEMNGENIHDLVTLSRLPSNSQKTVREFLQMRNDDMPSSSRGDYSGVRMHAHSRLMPVPQPLTRVTPGNYVVQSDIDWRDEQRRDIEICEFFDSLSGDKQIAFRRMLERLGERIPKPLLGSRKYFRSTLSPHVKLELLSDSAMSRVRAEMQIPQEEKNEEETEFACSTPGLTLDSLRFFDNRGNRVYMFDEDYADKDADNVSYDGAHSPDVIVDAEFQGDSSMSQKPDNLEPIDDLDPSDGPPQIEAQEPIPPELLPPQLHHIERPVIHSAPRLRDSPVASASLKNRWFVVPELRKDLIGTTHVKVSRGSIEPHAQFICSSCQEVMPRNMYEAHLRKVNRYGSCDHYTPRRFACTEKDCNQRLPSIEKLCTHLRIQHKVPLEIKEKGFENEDEFEIFLRELEGRGGNFRMSRGNKSSREGVQIKYYRCNRNVRMQAGKKIIAPDGIVVRPGVSTVESLMEDVEDVTYEQDEAGVPKTTRKKPSKLFIHGMCTAFFKKLEFQDGRIHVRYCDYHLHSDAVLRIPDNVRERIKELNFKRLPVPVIIKVMRAEANHYAEEGSALEERIQNITDKDVRNVLARCGLRPVKLQMCRNKLMQQISQVPVRPFVSYVQNAGHYHPIEDDNDPNRPPSPASLTVVERTCYEEWKQEDIDSINEAAEKRREAMQLRRRRESVMDEFEDVVGKLKADFFSALSDEHVRRVRDILEELLQMYTDTSLERHKGLLRVARRDRKSSPIRGMDQPSMKKSKFDDYNDRDEEQVVEEDEIVEVDEMDMNLDVVYVDHEPEVVDSMPEQPQRPNTRQRQASIAAAAAAASRNQRPPVHLMRSVRRVQQPEPQPAYEEMDEEAPILQQQDLSLGEQPYDHHASEVDDMQILDAESEIRTPQQSSAHVVDSHEPPRNRRRRGEQQIDDDNAEMNIVESESPRRRRPTMHTMDIGKNESEVDMVVYDSEPKQRVTRSRRGPEKAYDYSANQQSDNVVVSRSGRRVNQKRILNM